MVHVSNHDVRMTLQRNAHSFAQKLFVFHRNSANQILLQLIYSGEILESINHSLNVTQLESCSLRLCVQVYLSQVQMANEYISERLPYNLVVSKALIP